MPTGKVKPKSTHYVLKVKGISIIQWFCLNLLTVGIPIENSISEDFFRFAITQNLTDQS